MNLYLKPKGKEVALGNGTRPAGFLLGNISAGKHRLADLCAMAMRCSGMDAMTGVEFKPADGVLPIEAFLALRNCIVSTDKETAPPVETIAAEAFSDEGEAGGEPA